MTFDEVVSKAINKRHLYRPPIRGLGIWEACERGYGIYLSISDEGYGEYGLGSVSNSCIEVAKDLEGLKDFCVRQGINEKHMIALASNLKRDLLKSMADKDEKFAQLKADERSIEEWRKALD